MIEKRWTKQAGLAVVLALLVVAVAAVLPVAAGGRPLNASLSGATEVPGPGDPDGSGAAHVTLNQGQLEVCWDITVDDIDAVAMAHIHRGAAGVAGPVVVDFMGTLQGCRDDVNAALIKEIRQNPAGFYVNVHTGPFPSGAVRGQLSK